MFGKKIILLLLVFGLAISLFSTWSTSRMAKSLHKDYIEIKSNLFDCEYENKRYKEKFTQNIFSENQHISNISLLDPKLDTVPIANIIKSSKLVYRFYKGTCVQCVEDELDIVKQLADSIGANNILVISNHDKVSSLKAVINRKQITSPFFVYKDKFNLRIEVDELEIASFFLLDSNLRTRFVFKTGGDQYISDSYYKRIISFFKAGY